MIDYLDPSLLVAWLSREDRADDVSAWLGQRGHDHIVISHWTLTEVSAALSRKVRVGRLTTDEKIEVQSSFRKLLSDTFLVLPVDHAHFVQASRFADAHQIGLRSADALHLAIADGARARVVTLDKAQSKAAEKLGIANLLL